MQPEIRKDYLPYGLHSIDEDEIEAVTRILKSSWITGGQEVTNFENDFKNFVNSNHAIACSNGTTVSGPRR